MSVTHLTLHRPCFRKSYRQIRKPGLVSRVLFLNTSDGEIDYYNGFERLLDLTDRELCAFPVKIIMVIVTNFAGLFWLLHHRQGVLALINGAIFHRP